MLSSVSAREHSVVSQSSSTFCDFEDYGERDRHAALLELAVTMYEMPCSLSIIDADFIQLDFFHWNLSVAWTAVMIELIMYVEFKFMTNLSRMS